MNKNINMLKCYLNVLKNDIETTKKVIPDMYVENFYNIDFSFLKKIGIKYLLIDIDGTILPVDDINVPEELIRRINLFKAKHFDICLVSNNSEERVLPVAQALGVKYLCNANKPLPEAFDKALKVLEVERICSVAMIGDQMLSDIKGARENGIYAILVKPISEHNNIKTGTQRILQRKMENHLKRKDYFDRDVYYNSK